MIFSTAFFTSKTNSKEKKKNLPLLLGHSHEVLQKNYLPLLCNKKADSAVFLTDPVGEEASYDSSEMCTSTSFKDLF